MQVLLQCGVTLEQVLLQCGVTLESIQSHLHGNDLDVKPRAFVPEKD
jgi:hypothetical protein